MLFKDLGLNDNILKAISECGYESPTPIQEQAIPHVLMARDVVGLAQTGTGKTAGFTLPMIEVLAGGRAKARMPRSLVLSPTRELAAQIAENFETYGKYTELSMALLTGGTSMNDQIKKLERGVDVLIATPGRMIDLFERGKILLTDIKILVIDEADRMLDMGFIPDIEKIIKLLPFNRQTLLFSATMAPEIQKLTEKFLSNPRIVEASAPATTATTVEQFVVHCSPKDKEKILERLIREEKVQNAFIFCNRKRDIDGLVRYLKGKGYDAKGLHGDMAQKLRTETLQDVKDGKVSLLVCSDVAGRGLDVTGLSHVFNYDVPMNADDYVHRIGRTGRAGADGRAWMLATSREAKYLDAIEKLTKKPIQVANVGGEQTTDKTSQKASSKKSDKPAEKSAEKPSAPKKDHKRSDEKPRQEKASGKPKQSDKPVRKAQEPIRQDEVSAKPRKSRDDDDDSDDGGVKGFGNELPSFFSN